MININFEPTDKNYTNQQKEEATEKLLKELEGIKSEFDNQEMTFTINLDDGKTTYAGDYFLMSKVSEHLNKT